MEVVSRSWRSSGCVWCNANSSASWTQFHLRNQGTLRETIVVEEIQKDIDAGRLHARELIIELNRADSRSAVRRWVAVGVIAASNLLVLGAVLGGVLARVLK